MSCSGALSSKFAIKYTTNISNSFYLAPFLRSDSFYVLLTPLPFHPNFGDVPVAPDRPCWSWASTSAWALIGREIIFEECQPM